MKKIICLIKGHRWILNFKDEEPESEICLRCHQRVELKKELRDPEDDEDLVMMALKNMEDDKRI